MRRALVAVAVLAGCIAPEPPAQNDLARPVAPRPAAAAPTPAAPSPTAPSVMAEVELGGTVTLPPHVKGDVTVWIVDSPCWQAGTHAFNSTKAVLGKWFVEVYVPQGTNLWVCGAVGDGNKPLEIYGQADRAPLLGKGVGEVPFQGLSIKLARGKRVAAPAKR